MAATPQHTTPLGIFNYGSLQSMMVFFSVPVGVVRPLLAGTGLEPGLFDGQALVNLNFERYASFGSTYSSVVNEVEFNAVVFPKYKTGQEPALQEIEKFDSAAQAKKNVVRAVESVAEKLGNTKTVCRKCYIHPLVLERWSEGRLADEMAAVRQSFRKPIDGLDEEETLVLKWLSNAGNGVG